MVRTAPGARACLEAGLEPLVGEYDGKDPIAFVVSANLHRRHLNASQTGHDWRGAVKHEAGRRQEQSFN